MPTPSHPDRTQHAAPHGEHSEHSALLPIYSRVYLLRPGPGLAQLTTDDIRDHGDAMANLRQDSVISNAMSADTAFVVNHRRVQLNTPWCSRQPGFTWAMSSGSDTS